MYAYKFTVTSLKYTSIYCEQNKGGIPLCKMENVSTQVQYCKAWQPVVTSTPLKRIPKTANSFNVKNENKKEKLKNSKSKYHNSSNSLKKENDRNKKISKKKSIIYFDASSSSEEDSLEINNNSGIKITVESPKKSVLKNKKLSRKKRNGKSRELIHTNEENTSSLTRNKKENSCNVSKFNNKLFQSKINSKNMKNVISSSPSKGKSEIENKSNVEKSIREENNKETGMCETTLSKRKGSKHPGLFISKKKVKKEPVESPVTSNASSEIITDCITPPNGCNKKNTSHQLFSDSKVQELIDSLDLTANDEDIFTQDFDSSHNNNKNTQENKDKESEQKAASKTDLNDEKKQRVLVRQRQAPREFWLPANEISKGNLVINNAFKQKRKINKHLNNTNFCSENENELTFLGKSNELKKTGENENEIINFALKETGTTKNIDCSSKNQKNVLINKTVDSNEESKKVPSDATDITGKEAVNLVGNNCSKIRKKHQSHRLIQKENNHFLKDKKSIINFKSKNSAKNKIIEAKTGCSQSNHMVVDTFKHFNQLTEFVKVQQGCFATDCWSFRNYKCGIVKISSKSTLSNKTKYDNSYFGGVLVKGSLRMKIGEAEVELKESDTVCVPPLTKWSAKNISESETLFYFWSGRFKA